jgi:hypothetical protein
MNARIKTERELNPQLRGQHLLVVIPAGVVSIRIPCTEKVAHWLTSASFYRRIIALFTVNFL